MDTSYIGKVKHKNESYPYNLLSNIFWDDSWCADKPELTESQANKLSAALNTLTPRRKEFTELYFKENLTYRDIAAKFSVTTGCVHQNIHKSLTILRFILKYKLPKGEFYDQRN